MKKTVALLLVLETVVSLTACRNTVQKLENEPTDVQQGTEQETEQENHEEPQKDYADMTAEELLEGIKDPQQVTLEEYVALVSTLSNVAITEELELENNITTEALGILIDNGAELPEPSEYVKPLLKSDAPQVRGYALSKISSLFGISNDYIAAVKEMLKNETDPYVICCGVKVLANKGGSDTEIGEFLLDAAKHENSRVRYEAAMALGNSWNSSLDGAVDTIITLMDDEDDEVRKVAYRYAGRLEDERIIEPIVTMLNNAEDANLHSNGVESLLTLWYDYPSHGNTSEAAYRATMDYLKTTPCTSEIPAWTALSGLLVKADNNFEQWRAQATYYDPEEIAQIMTSIVGNPDANWLARDNAVKVMFIHCSKDAFDTLGTVVQGLTDDKAKYIQDTYQTYTDKLSSQENDT